MEKAPNVVFSVNEDGENILEIESITRDQSGAFACSAQNIAGEGMSSIAQVDVLCKFVFYSKTCIKN